MTFFLLKELTHDNLTLASSAVAFIMNVLTQLRRFTATVASVNFQKHRNHRSNRRFETSPVQDNSVWIIVSQASIHG